MIAVTGYNSTIVQELKAFLPDGELVTRIDHEPPACDRFLFCAGVLHPKTILQQTAGEIIETLMVNAIDPIQYCERILGENDRARICVIGSESGYSWSHNGTYAAAKAAVHKYIETKKLKPQQQLVGIAPSIIGDTGMTERRTDLDNLDARRQAHPKQRFLKAAEVARLVHFLLYQDEGYLTGTVIRLNGGGR